MLGFHRMTHDGTATVLSCMPKRGGLRSTSIDAQGRHIDTYELILDVVPDGAPPFRAETQHRFSRVRHPGEGDSLTVRCNPERRAVEIDISDDGRFNPKIFRAEDKRRREAEHDRLMNTAPGTPVPHDGADIEGTVKDREARLKDLDERLERGDISSDAYNREVQKLIGEIGTN